MKNCSVLICDLFQHLSLTSWVLMSLFVAKNYSKTKWLRAPWQKLAVTGILNIIVRASERRPLCTTNLHLNRLWTVFGIVTMTKNIWCSFIPIELKKNMCLIINTEIAIKILEFWYLPFVGVIFFFLPFLNATVDSV